MFRWLILLGTLALWLLCMALVYDHTRPPPLRETIPGMQAGLDTLFAEDAEPQRVWRIFVDLDGLKAASRRDAADGRNSARTPWTGVNEDSLRDIGWLECTLKRREHDVTRLEQVTEAELAVPEDANLPLLQLMGVLHYRSRADLSLDYGLEVFSSTLSMGMGLQARSHGVRDNDELRITQQVFQGHRKLFDQLEFIPIGSKSAPLVELMPFQRNGKVREGYSWDIAMLDSTMVNVDNTAKPRLVALKVKCTGRRNIIHEGEKVAAYEVSSADGKARAWYSGDGTVLKQAYTIADTLDVMVVRADPTTYLRRPGLRRSGSALTRQPAEAPQKSPE